MLRLRSKILTSLAVGALAFGSIAPASATPQVDEGSEISFGYFQTDDWPTVRAAMVKSNGEAKVTAFLELVAKNPSLIDKIPGLSSLPREAALQEIIEPAASSSGFGGGTAVGQASFALASHAQSVAPAITPMSYSTAPVAGSPINSGRAWTYSNRFNNTTCTITGCTTQCYLDFRLTSNPGFTASNTDYNLLRFGSCIGTVTFNLEIWTGSSRIEQTTLYTSGSSGRIYQQPHASTYGKTMYFYYDLLIQAPAPGNAEWKSRGAFCGGSSSTAYCKFS